MVRFLRRRLLLVLAMSCISGISWGNEPEKKEAESRTLRIALLSGSEEYESAVTMPMWKLELEKNYDVRCDLLQADRETRIDGLARLENADLVVVFTRRIKMPKEELKPLMEYVASKKPIIGIRTASHGFQEYLEFDKEVLGGNYQNHYGKGKPTKISVVSQASEHPVLRGIVTDTPWTSDYSMYRTGPLAGDCIPLLVASSPVADQDHPAAWVRESEGRRIFYTTLGGRTDFDSPKFQALLINAVRWTTRYPLPKKVGLNDRR